MNPTNPINQQDVYKRLPEVVQCLASLKNVQFAYLFGSLARRRSNPMSDVDFAVYLHEDSDFSEGKLYILGRLMDILETDKIDLVVLNTAPLPLAMNILKSRQVLVDKLPHTRHLFESKIMRTYFDFSVLESSILERRYYRGRR